MVHETTGHFITSTPNRILTRHVIDSQLFLHERQVLDRSTHLKMEWKTLQSSAHSRNTVNPVRKIADACQVQHNPEKSIIRLNLGDPSIGGILPPCRVAMDAIHESIDSHRFDGYGPAVGAVSAREAIVTRYSTSETPFNVDDVVLASGCSHALQMAIESVADAGDNILVPHPGFPLYSTLCRPHGIVDKPYRINMAPGDVQIDLTYLERLIDEKTKALIVNNPGNPTGGVFTKQHLEDILKLACKYRLIVIADEIYGDLVYNGAQFHPIASLSPNVPVLTCDGIAKRWMVPGWRLGWVIIHDRFGVLSETRKGIIALSQKIVGPCAIVQGALPKMLADTPDEYFEYTRKVIETNANIVDDILKDVPGITSVKPQGAMYMMIGINKAHYFDDVTFCQTLIKEESVICLPGQAFSAPNYFRLVLCSPAESMEEAAKRIKEFCARHYKAETENEESSDEGCDLSTLESD